MLAEESKARRADGGHFGLAEGKKKFENKADFFRILSENSWKNRKAKEGRGTRENAADSH